MKGFVELTDVEGFPLHIEKNDICAIWQRSEYTEVYVRTGDRCFVVKDRASQIRKIIFEVKT